MENALTTPGFLEQIFLFSEIRTLLIVQRVCQRWHALITFSPSVQKHLFFAPDHSCSPPIFNPLMIEVFDWWFPGDRHSSEDLENIPWARKSHNDAFVRPESSWRRMLPRQPPIRTLRQCIKSSGMAGWTITVVDVSVSADVDHEREQLSASDLGERVDKANDKNTRADVAETEKLCMPMEIFYRLVVHDSNNNHRWRFIWANRPDPDDSQPRPAWQQNVASRRSIQSALEKDGVAIYMAVGISCTPHIYDDLEFSPRLGLRLKGPFVPLNECYWEAASAR